MFDLKVMNSVLGELEEERGIPREKVVEAIEAALATAYKKEYAKRGQIIRAHIDLGSGTTEFHQIKEVVDESSVQFIEGEEEIEEPAHTPFNKKYVAPVIDPDAPVELPRFNSEQHILLADAKFIKRDAKVGDELVFPLEMKDDYGRIAAQTAKQVIIQKIREAEKVSVVAEFGKHQGEIVSGTVQRMERGNIYIDLGRATGILPYDEQIPGERYRQGERIRALLYQVEESPRGIYLRLSRANPQFLVKLFAMEAPEVANGTVIFKEVAREAGSRSKVAVTSTDSHVDPVGSLVGQRGVRVSTVTSELGGEKIDIIEWNENIKSFIEEALSPARITSVELDEAEHKATIKVAEDQQSLAIGRGGQNVRLAAKLTGWRLDIQSVGGPKADAAVAEAETKEEVAEVEHVDVKVKEEAEVAELVAEADASPETPAAE
jgi:N utilization substance protein A